MLSKATLKLALMSVILIGSANFSASADDKNYAYQLQLLNCGEYQFWKVSLQRKASGSSNWKEVTNKQTNITKGYAICFDASQWSEFKQGDEARLKGFIDLGDSKKCDSTNYSDNSANATPRRKMEMAGTTRNNNGCRSKGYAAALNSNQCGKKGTVSKLSC